MKRIKRNSKRSDKIVNERIENVFKNNWKILIICVSFLNQKTIRNYKQNKLIKGDWFYEQSIS